MAEVSCMSIKMMQTSLKVIEIPCDNQITSLHSSLLDIRVSFATIDAK
jgi:hypothetical protein